MAHLQSSNEIDDLIRRYGAHDSQLEGHSLEQLDILGQTLCLDSSLVHGFQMRAHHLAQLGEMRQVPLAVKKWPTKLAFELPYRTRERRLRHVALFRRAREVQFLCHPEEIPNLIHFHDNLTGMVDKDSVAESVGIGSYSPGRCVRVLEANRRGLFLLAVVRLNLLLLLLLYGWPFAVKQQHGGVHVLVR